MTYITDNYMEEGGNRWIIGGKLEKSADAPILDALTPALPQHYQIAPAAVGVDSVHAAIDLTEEVQTITTGITDPDVPRIVSVKGNQAGVTGNVVITGTNIADEEITETIALNEATEVLGTKAFKTVTSIELPVLAGAGDTVSVGVGKKFGIVHIVANAALLLVKLFNGSSDGGSLAVDDDELEKNLYSLSGTPNGEKVVDLYYLI